MIEDILFEFSDFIFEIPLGVSGGNILSYSLDGDNYDLEIVGEKEIITVIIG